MLQDILNARINELWTFYKATGDIGHQGEKGLLREMFLRKLLESVLPPHFGIGSGVVVDFLKRQSPQVDLVIFDRRKLPPIFEQNGHGIYPIDAVLRVIEVKSTLNKSGLEQMNSLHDAFDPSSATALRIVTKGNLDGGQCYYPLLGLFAYRTNIKNLKTTKTKVIGSRNIKICIAEGGNISGQLDMAGRLRFFLTEMLTELEATAASRKGYSLMEWMSW